MQELIKIDVLDHGYVLHKPEWLLGSGDLEPVNDARVSFDKESMALTDKDQRLLAFLADHGHTSPFRHSVIKFEIFAPLMVARQWWKYVVGSGHDETTAQDPFTAWNESSRRYITEPPVFYTPAGDEWRRAPEDKKQGSGDLVPLYNGERLTEWLIDTQVRGIVRYEKALEMGVAPEQARLFLPAYGLYVRWRWTASLQSVCHFINQRVAHDAQKEIQAYALAVLRIVGSRLPESTLALTHPRPEEV